MSNIFQKFLNDRFIKPVLDQEREKIEKEKLEFKKIAQTLESKVRLFEQPSQMEFYFGSSVNKKPLSTIDFDSLRKISVSYDVARACINTRKRQITSLRWIITPKDRKADLKFFKKEIADVENFFQMPGGKNVRWRKFIDKVMEDLLVLDAIILWKERAKNGKLLKLVNVDGATVRLKLNEDGSTPEPPDTAYVQVIKGEKVAEFTTDEMYYEMMNPRTNSPYGLSPLESLILGVDAALRSQLINLSLLTEGNIPEGFFSLPENWGLEKIKEFQVYFDALMAGNPIRQSRIKFMPGGKGVTYIPTRKPDDMRFLEYEEWLLKKCCALFEVQPQEIGYTLYLNRATSEVQYEIGQQRGLYPTASFLKELFDIVIRQDLGYPELEFNWVGLDQKDELRDIEKIKNLIPLGVISADEVRTENGLEPIGLEHYIMTSGGPVKVSDFRGQFRILNQENGQESKKEKIDLEIQDNEILQLKEEKEIKAWQKKALKNIEKGKEVKFVSDIIDPAIRKIIDTKLKFAKTKDDVKAIFRPIINRKKTERIINKALSLKEEIEKILNKKNVYNSTAQFSVK